MEPGAFERASKSWRAQLPAIYLLYNLGLLRKIALWKELGDDFGMN